MILNALFFALGILLPSAPQPKTAELDKLVDQWHKDAADAKFDAYFAFMDESFVYIGTAPNERWPKPQFADFCKPYFDKGKAWDFKMTERKWNFSEDGKTAWFDEVLDTWMMDCRGTGVMIKTAKGWKIVLYDLHVLVENEKINEFLELRKQQ